MKFAVRTLALAAVALLSACGPMTRADQIATITGTASAGASIYTAQCASCHGTDGKGTSSGVDLHAPAKSETQVKVLNTIINGVTNTAMVSYGALTNQQLADLYAFIKANFGT